MTEATSGNLVDVEATYPFSNVCPYAGFLNILEDSWTSYLGLATKQALHTRTHGWGSGKDMRLVYIALYITLQNPEIELTQSQPNAPKSFISS